MVCALIRFCFFIFKYTHTSQIYIFHLDYKSLQFSISSRSYLHGVLIARVGPVVSVQTGSLRGWTIIPRLPQITAPTLLYNGEYDTSRDISQIPFFELIPSVRWITFPGGSHMNHVEGGGHREKTLKLIGDFLIQDKSIEILES